MTTSAPSHWQYPACAEPLWTAPPAMDSWFQPTCQPLLLVEPRQPGLAIGILEPTFWVEPTMDSWFRPASEPVLPPPPRPHGGGFYQADPSVFSVESITLDKWFALACQPLLLARARRPDLFAPVVDPSIFRGRFYLAARGKYRVFNAAEYRFYRSSSGPPVEGDTPFATNATLPHTPADVYGDATWYLSVSYFNGVIDSGFLPLGEGGETYLRLDISAGELTGSPPRGPLDWRLEVRASGVVRVIGVCYQADDLRADQWSIAYTVDSSTPPEDTPDDNEAMATRGLAVLSYDLPGQANGTTVKVRLQTRRNDGSDESPSWVYSDDSEVLTATADAVGPTVPLAGERWPGQLPEEL